MDEEREYQDEDVVTCSTGVTVKAGDEVTIVLVDGEPTVIASSSSEQTASAAGETASYFWHDEQGAHVSEQPESTEGNNVLIDQDSVDIRNGESVMASFDQAGMSVNAGGYEIQFGADDTSAVIASEGETSGAVIKLAGAVGSMSLEIEDIQRGEMESRTSLGGFTLYKLQDKLRLWIRNIEGVSITHPQAFLTALGLATTQEDCVFLNDFSGTAFVMRYGNVVTLRLYAVSPSTSKTYNVTNNGQSICTIPDGFKPSGYVCTDFTIGNTYHGRLWVNANGTVHAMGAAQGSTYYSGTGSFSATLTYVI